MKRILLIYLVLLGNTAFSQRDKDTIPVIMLVCDTVNHQPIKKAIWRLDIPDGDYNKEKGVWMYRHPPVWWEYGYSVREKHNTIEGIIDPGFDRCTDDLGNTKPCYQDYWLHVYYLDAKKSPLSKSIVVWQSK